MTGQVLTPEFISEVIEHMNVDHAASLRDYLTAFTSVAGAENIRMTDLTVGGLELEYQSGPDATEKVWIQFGREISRPEQVRGTLVAMAKRARKEIEESKISDERQPGGLPSD